MAEKSIPPANYLQQFEYPIWQLAKLDRLKALAIVEGRREPYPFTILELEHRAIGLFAQQWEQQVSTIFILKLDETERSKRHIPQPPANLTVWADSAHLYLARLGKRTAVAEWQGLLAQAVHLANNLTVAPVNAAAPRAALASDSKFLMFWWIVAGILPGLQILLGLHALSSVLNQGYYSICTTGREFAELRLGWQAYWYALALCLPLPALMASLYLQIRYAGRAGLTWRLLLAGALVWLMSFAGWTIAYKHTQVSQLDKQGQAVACVRK